MGFLACLVAIVVLIILIQRPPPAAIVLVGAHYADNLTVPHNVLGWKGLAGIKAVSQTRGRWSLLPRASLQLIRPEIQLLNESENWDKLIEDLKKNSHREQTILIVVELHGATDSGGAYLIPGKLTDPEPKQRLDLKKVIQSMRLLPTKQHKILVLEGAQVPAHWRLGMLHNDFARRLEELEPEIASVENLWVLSGCDVDQRCWGSEGLGRTVFSHYIIQALCGEADTDDRRLTLDKLYKYVRKNVRTWVWNARGAIQEPVLLPRSERPSTRGRDDEGESEEEGKAGKKASRKPASEVHLATAATSPRIEESSAPDEARLREIWRQFHQLDELVPHPAVYSPRRWRQYKAEVIRYEELSRCGAEADWTRGVKQRIDALASKLESDRHLKVSASAENTLVMNVVAGGAIETGSVAPEKFTPFWTSRGPESVQRWEALRASDVPTGETHRSLRIQADDYLLKRAFDDPAKNLEPAAEKLLITKASGFTQPAEVHFLRMLAQWPGLLNPRLPALVVLVKQALSVRRLAEEAAVGASDTAADYSYSEQVHPWILSQIQRGDKARREGEDLLFSAEPAAWTRSADALRQARDAYGEALRRADTIRAALAARDHALASLPDYSAWLAHRHSDELQDNLTRTVESLWKETHESTDLLEKPRDDLDFDSLAKNRWKPLSNGLTQLEKQFAEKGFQAETARLKEDWEALTAAAAVPFPDKSDLALRSAIWTRLGDIQKHDREVAVPGKSTPVNLSAEDKEQHARDVRRRAQIQGRMALASLGSRWFDDSDLFKNQGDFQSTAKKVRRALESEERSAGEPWRQELTDAGDLIGQRWRQMDPLIGSLTSEKNGLTNFGDFQERLTRADRLGRQLDQGAPPLEESAREAAARLREARVHNLLLEMAKRTRLDHWYDEEPKDHPYYQVVGSKFLTDAENLFPNSPIVAAEREKLNQKAELGLEGPPHQVLTSEPSVALSYKIVPIGNGDIPEGIPVVRPDPDSQLELEGATNEFRAVSRGGKSDSIEFSVKSPLLQKARIDPKLIRPEVRMAALKVEGRFRGQHFDRTTEVQLHPVPDTIAIGPPPPDPEAASIAIRADREIFRHFGAGNGSVAIVLDCSGSMNYPENNPKFPQAKQALAEVLNSVPTGTTVSIWTFSQLPDNIPLGPTGEALPPPELQAEAVRLGEEPERTIHPLRTPAPWAKDQIDGVIKQLDRIRPYLHTPLVEAMWNAAATDLKDAKGMKTLLVLTDGNDDRFKKNEKFNKTKVEVPDFILSAFRGLEIHINMVFFTPAGDPAELALARANFEEPLKKLNPPGSFVTADNVIQLIQKLKRGISQKLTCLILKPDGTPVGEALDVTAPAEADKWSVKGLTPGSYKLRVRANTFYEHDIDLKKGERLLVKLVDGPKDSIAFERDLYGNNQEFENREKQEKKGSWQLAVLANQQQGRGQEAQLQLFAALERNDPGTDRLQQVKPRLAWFRLEADKVESPETKFSVRWRERIFYPGPAWHFDVPRWIREPGDVALARPILTAWWRDPDSELPAHVFHLDAPGNPGALPRDLKVDDGKVVTIEFVGVEDHYVEVEPLKLEIKSCLVVRLAYPKDTPCLVDPSSLGLDFVVGYEHHLFSQARKYTGLFWPVNQPQFQKLSRLSVIGLEAFQREAVIRGQTCVIKLRRPVIGDPIPIPPEAILKGD